MRKARILGTFVPTDRKPDCRDCKHGDNIVKYRGRWVCNVHLKVKNTRVKDGPLGELIVMPSGVETPFNLKPEWSFGELFVNRAHRRQGGNNRVFA